MPRPIPDMLQLWRSSPYGTAPASFQKGVSQQLTETAHLPGARSVHEANESNRTVWPSELLGFRLLQEYDRTASPRRPSLSNATASSDFAVHVIVNRFAGKLRGRSGEIGVQPASKAKHPPMPAPAERRSR